MSSSATSHGFRHPAVAALLVVFLLLTSVTGVARADADDQELTVYVFMSVTCPVCTAQKPFLEALARESPRLNVVEFEVVTTTEHRALLQRMAAAHGVRPGSVPMIFFAGDVWIGDSRPIRTELTESVRRCLTQACPDSLELTDAERPEAPAPERSAAVLDVPLLGSVDLGVQPLLLSTGLIAFVDGFNPCSIWVLTMLLALVLHSHSRRRMLQVGLTFLFTTALIYGVFITGVFSVLAFAPYLPWIYWVVALFAITVGLINVKDYFWFRRGVSLTIADSSKPGLFRRMREVVTSGRSPLALIAATVVMASGIALIELPCTAGFPVIWSGLVRASGVGALEFALLLALYLLVYLGIELTIFAVALFRLRIDRFQERQGRVLKLAGGVIMLALALVLIGAPEAMSQVGPAMLVFALAFALTGLIVLAHRVLLPRFGIRIGDGW